MMYGFNSDRFATCFGYGGFMNNGSFPWIHMTMGLLVLALIAVTVAILIRKSKKVGTEDAVEALAMRYAKGEIGEEEYLQKKKVLK